jgi:hypothetical protein
MAKPESIATGTLVIPINDFNNWCLTLLPTGPFYSFGKIKDKGQNIEVSYNSSTAGAPNPPSTS